MHLRKGWSSYLLLASLLLVPAATQLVQYDPEYVPPTTGPPAPPHVIEAVATSRRLAALGPLEALDPDTRERLRRQEFRADGFHFEQSFNQNKAATVSRLGILLSEEKCRLTPSPVSSPDATYLMVECPHQVSRVSLQFLSGPPFREALTSSGRSPQRRLTFHLEPTGRLISEYIQACADPRDLSSCYAVQIDARRLPDKVPQPLRLLALSPAERTSATIDFNPKAPEHRVVVFENEPVTLVLTAAADALVDTAPLQPFQEVGFTNQTQLMSFRPRGPSDTRTFFLSDKEHAIANNVTIIAETVPSTSALLYDMRVSTGRLDPPFRPTTFAYFLRVSEYARSVKFRLTALDDQHTLCSYVGPEDDVALLTGHGTTGYLPASRPTFIFECAHPKQPDHHVRYIVQTVRQLGGSTLLRSLDVVGAGLQQPFTSHHKGPYTVNMLNSEVPDLSWVSFVAVPENHRALVSVEGLPCDPASGRSPFFRVALGETRKFRIYVRTRENDIAETYEVIVARPTDGVTTFKRLGDVMGYVSTFVSSNRAYTFIYNAKFLQWISVSNRINGLPEVYDVWSELFHKWNLQWQWPRLVEFAGPDGHPPGERRPFPVSHPSNSDPLGHKEPGSPADTARRDLTSDGFVAPPQRYGVIQASASVGSPSPPVAVQWSDSLKEWVASLPSSVSLAPALADLDAAAAGLRWARNVSTSLIDNFDFLRCKPADDCRAVDQERLEQERRERERQQKHQKRRLMSLSSSERDALVAELETAYKDSQKILDFTNSFTFTSLSLVALAGLYMLCWATWLHAPNDYASVRQDFPRILHPARFWLFVLDYALISYTQACCGLLFTPLKHAPIFILGFRTTPAALGTFCAVMLVVFPVCFIGLGCALLVINQGTLVYSKVFQRYTDPRIGSYRAFWRPLPWLPIVGRLFDIEISRFIEGHATDGEGEPLQALEEERRTQAPWLEPDNQRVFSTYRDDAIDAPLLKTSLPAQLKYYRDLDAVKIGAPPYVGLSKNSRLVARFPEAFLTFCKHPVRNAYGQELDVLCKVQLRHWANIIAARGPPVVIFPREHVEFIFADALNTLVAKSQMANFMQWGLDRIGSLALILIMSMWHDAGGMRTVGLFAVTSALLAVLYLPSVVRTSLSHWYRQMEADFRLETKMGKYEKQEDERFSVWPYRDEEAREQFEKMRQQRRLLKTSQVFYSLYDRFFTTVDAVRYSDFWKTRAAFAISAFLQGPVMTELMKMLVMLNMALASRGAAMTLSRGSSYVSIALIAVALVCLNWEAWQELQRQMLATTLYEVYVSIRRVLIYVVDMAKDPQAFADRLSFYVTQTVAYLTQPGGTISFLYNGFQAETVRDFKCHETAVISNEIGVQMFGDIKLSNEARRQMHDEEDPLSLPRYTMQKTLVTAGTIAVHRPELDRAMPIVLPITQFNHNAHDPNARVAATIQIVNHNTLRYVPKVRHDWQDDSFLTLFTDPGLVPPPGKIRRGLPGHGYVVKVDKVDQSITIRGPGILADKTYNIKLTYNSPEMDDRYAFDETSQVSSAHLSGRKEAECVCLEPGRLVVDVPPGFAPDLQEEMKIFPPDGREETHDPARHKVVWDPNSRKMIIRTQHALLAGDQKYHVVWSAKPRGGLVHATTTEPAPIRGEIRLMPNVGEEVIDLASAAWCVVRDTDKTMTIDIDMKETNAYEFVLSGVDLPGASGFLSSLSGAVLGELDCIFGQNMYATEALERIPCTLVQCVDPIARKWRVEPDFDEAIFRISARKEELIAISEQLRRQFDSLSDLWYRVISPAEFVNFWRERGLNVLDQDSNFVDPIRYPQDPRVRSHSHLVHGGEAALQQLLSTRLSQQLQVLNALQSEYKVWASAYRSRQLYDAQTTLDATLQDPRATMEDRAMAVELVRRLKRPFQQSLPNFVYPMVVQEKLITRQSKWEAQFLQWEQQISSWLHHEEGAAKERGSHGDLSCFEFTLFQIMRALRFTANKPENLLRGRTQTALHYVTSSREVRGMNITWRPDPLGSSLALMRVFGEDDSGRASPQQVRWEMCYLKLTTLGIKVMFPYTKEGQPELCPEEPWSSCRGYYIPLKCFEALLCMEDRSPLSEDECSYDFAESMTGRLVFRRNTDAAVVHDNYVLRLHDKVFENTFLGEHGSRQFIQLGFTADATDAEKFLPRELWYEQQQAHDKLYSFPLSFRLWPADIRRWESVIAACGMDKPPRDNADFDGRAPGNEIEEVIITRPVVPIQEIPEFTATDRDLDLDDEPDDGGDDRSGDDSNSDDTNEIMADQISFDAAQPMESSYSSELMSSHHSTAPPSEPAQRPLSPQEPPYDSSHFLGEQQDWRFHGEGTLTDQRGTELYDGQFHEGQRNGRGAATFWKNGRKWKYEGTFVSDEPCGTGVLTLMDHRELERLKASKAEQDKTTIVGFSGTFAVPKELTRGDTLPTAAVPTCDLVRIREFFDQDRPVNVESPTVSENAAPTPRRAEGATEDGKLAPYELRQKILTVDNRRSMSVSGHEEVMDTDMATLNETFFYGRAPKDRHDMTPDDYGLPIGDGRIGPDEFLPHTGRWARVLDPSLGYQDIGARMGYGEVFFADGSRYKKDDDRGLTNDRPNGKGHYFCPHCPLNYYGDFRNGRPEGYGCLEVGEGDNKVTYWGTFKDGKRHGEGVLVARNDKLYIEGHFENDKLSGGNARIQIHSDLKNKVNFQWIDAEFKNGLPHGRGSVNFFRDVKGRSETGLTYRGEFQDGVRAGLGVVYDTDDQPILKSEWLNDAPSGRADAYYLKSGHVYVGPMKSGARSGMGKLFESIAGGLIYDGMWDNSLPHGRGTLHCPEGIYEGEFTHGKRHGKGTLRLIDTSNGAAGRREYEGSWIENKPHGVGKYTFSEEEQPIVVVFEDGRLKSKSVKKYRQGGPCGALPDVPEITLSDIPALEDKHAEYQEKCNQLNQSHFTILQEWTGDLWSKHEKHPFEFTLVKGDMPERPQKREFVMPLAPKPELTDSDFVYRLVIKHARGLVKTGLRAPRASVRVGLLHHDVATKPDDVNGADPVWNQTIVLPFVRTQLLRFTVCDNHMGISGGADTQKEIDRPLGYGVFQLMPWLETGIPFIEQEVPLEIKDEKKNETTRVGTLAFKLEKAEYTPDMQVHRDQYDWAALRHHKRMPDEHKEALLMAPPPQLL